MLLCLEPSECTRHHVASVRCRTRTHARKHARAHAHTHARAAPTGPGRTARAWPRRVGARSHLNIKLCGLSRLRSEQPVALRHALRGGGVAWRDLERARRAAKVLAAEHGAQLVRAAEPEGSATVTAAERACE